MLGLRGGGMYYYMYFLWLDTIVKNTFFEIKQNIRPYTISCVGRSGVQNATTGLWSDKYVFSGVRNYIPLTRSLWNESEFGGCPERAIG